MHDWGQTVGGRGLDPAEWGWLADQTQQADCQLCWSGSHGWSAVVVAVLGTARPGYRKGRCMVARTRQADARPAWLHHISLCKYSSCGKVDEELTWLCPHTETPGLLHCPSTR